MFREVLSELLKDLFLLGGGVVSLLLGLESRLGGDRLLTLSFPEERMSNDGHNITSGKIWTN